MPEPLLEARGIVKELAWRPRVKLNRYRISVTEAMPTAPPRGAGGAA